VATCTAYNEAYLRELVGPPSAARVKRIYHGLDVTGYEPLPHRSTDRPMLLAVGQLKEKKGFRYLLEACRLLLDRGMDFECEIVGEGPLRASLQKTINDLALTNTVNLAGSLPHDEVIQRYRRADVFVLPSVTAADGDRDGIPNVILEAMAMQLPVVSTRHSGIPEVVQHGTTGLLVPPKDPEALADTLGILIGDKAARVAYGVAGRQRVVEVFDLEVNVKKLLGEMV
jgi:glycosyltransferase involved in cell wall biosynthesis